jgi:uncharacterized protein YcnI
VKPAFIIAVLSAAAGAAQAHVTLEEPQALAGTSYKAVLRVGHGCAGSATTALTVRIPPGFRNAKPMPKAGWTIALRGDATGASEISWTAASRADWLPDAYYDEFVLRGQTPAEPGLLWFKVLQQCETGQGDWSEVPTSGSDIRGLKAPAAPLDVLPNEHAGHEHMH